MFHQTPSHSLTLLSYKNQPTFHILPLILYLVRTAQYGPQHFSSEKYKILHFSRRKSDNLQLQLRLGNVVLRLKEEV